MWSGWVQPKPPYIAGSDIDRSHRAGVGGVSQHGPWVSGRSTSLTVVQRRNSRVCTSEMRCIATLASDGAVPRATCISVVPALRHMRPYSSVICSPRRGA